MSKELLQGGRVTAEIDGNMGIVTLNDPDNLNALDIEICEMLNEGINLLLDHDTVRVLLIRAEGKVFSVGGSLKAFAKQGDKLGAFVDSMTGPFHRGIRRFYEDERPVIAALHGVAGGGGASLVCAADLIIAGESGKINFAYTAAGLSPDGGSTWTLPLRVGKRKAYEILMLNPLLSARDALELGLVNKVVTDDDLEQEAMTWANTLASGATGAYGAVKRLLNLPGDIGLERHLELEAESIRKQSISNDGQEGIAAFLEKRKPDFKGN